MDASYCFRKDRRIYFAGQMTGVEGYIESAASGILAGINMAMALRQKPALILPADTMMGALDVYKRQNQQCANATGDLLCLWDAAAYFRADRWVW